MQANLSQKLRAHILSLRVGADDHRRSPMSIHMVRTRLRIILGHHNRSLFPILRMRNQVHQTTQSKIVIRHHRSRCWISRVSSLTVVTRKRHHHQMRQIPTLFKRLKLLFKNIHSVLITLHQRPVVVSRSKNFPQSGNVRSRLKPKHILA